jgi:hypothetical protein
MGSTTSISGANLVSATNLTGNISVASAAQANITSLGTLAALTVSGNVTTQAWIVMESESEVISTKTGATGVVVHDLSTSITFYHTSVAANFTVNFTNVPTTADRSIMVTLVIVQGASAFYPSAVQIDGVAQTLRWINATTPIPAASTTEIYTFTLLRISSAWTSVLGTYGYFG